MHLGKIAQAFGFALESYDEIASTNSLALTRAEQANYVGAPGSPLWIVAHSQTQGRGRHGRLWRSPRGNLYASLLLIDPCPRIKTPELGFVTGIAVYQAMQLRLAQCGVEAKPPVFGLKWPNDLLYAQAKCAGVLLEASQLADGRLAVVVGIGVNCHSYPEDLPYAATSLSAIAPEAGDPAQFFECLTDYMAKSIALWRRGENFSAIRAQWLECCLGLGAEISVIQCDKKITGRFETIDESGRLILQEGKVSTRIDAGDIFL